MTLDGSVLSGRESTGKPSFKDYLSITKTGITMANLMATFAGLWVASHGRPNVVTTIFTLVGTALVVMAGATLNDYVDRDIDTQMERTNQRAIASGKIQPQAAFWMGIVLGVAGTLVLAAGVNF